MLERDPYNNENPEQDLFGLGFGRYGAKVEPSIGEAYDLRSAVQLGPRRLAPLMRASERARGWLLIVRGHVTVTAFVESPRAEIVPQMDTLLAGEDAEGHLHRNRFIKKGNAIFLTCRLIDGRAAQRDDIARALDGVALQLVVHRVGVKRQARKDKRAATQRIEQGDGLFFPNPDSFTLVA
jgi:hypothetical protein